MGSLRRWRRSGTTPRATGRQRTAWRRRSTRPRVPGSTPTCTARKEMTQTPRTGTGVPGSQSRDRRSLRSGRRSSAHCSAEPDRRKTNGSPLRRRRIAAAALRPLATGLSSITISGPCSGISRLGLFASGEAGPGRQDHAGGRDEPSRGGCRRRSRVDAIPHPCDKPLRAAFRRRSSADGSQLTAAATLYPNCEERVAGWQVRSPAATLDAWLWSRRD